MLSLILISDAEEEIYILYVLVMPGGTMGRGGL